MNYECPACRDTGYKQIEPHARLYCDCWRGMQNYQRDVDHLDKTCRACKDTGYYATAPNVFKLCDCRAGRLRRCKTTTAPPTCTTCNGTGWGNDSPYPPYCLCDAGKARRRAIEGRTAALDFGAPTHAVSATPPRHELTEAEEAALDTAWARALGWVK